MLNFIQFINDSVDLTADKKLALLEDFVAQYHYEEEIDGGDGYLIPNPETKSQFANRTISRYIIESVQAARFTKSRAAVEIEKLELEPIP